jgi:hypothetical protein
MPAPANRQPRPRKPAPAPRPSRAAPAAADALEATLEIVAELLTAAGAEDRRWRVSPTLARWLDAMSAHDTAAFGGRDPEVALAALLARRPAEPGARPTGPVAGRPAERVAAPISEPA